MLLAILILLLHQGCLRGERQTALQSSLKLALHFHKQGDLDQAVTYYVKVLELKPDLPHVHRNLGAVFYQQSKCSEAKEHFAKAIELDATHAEGHLNMALVLSECYSDEQQAEHHARQALKFRPDYVKGHHMLGNLLQNRGAHQEAKVHHLAALQLSETNPNGDAAIAARLPRLEGHRVGDVEVLELTRRSRHRPDVPVSLEKVTLSMEPLLFYLPRFLSAEEASHVIEKAREKLKTSHTISSGGDFTDNHRKSSNTWLKPKEDEVLERIVNRVAEVSKLSLQLIKASEDLQVVHYSKGQHFDMHYDATPVLRRYLTVLYYLNTVTKGGHTYFPLANGTSTSDGVCIYNDVGNTEVDEGSISKTKCGTDDMSDGVAVAPVLGDAVLFYNYQPDGAIDTKALHAACELEEGEKWIANHWVVLPDE